MGIVILNWNNYPATARCLRSLSALRNGPDRIYLLDNGSKDGSMDRLELEFGGAGLTAIRNGQNLGFAAGCNPGMARALEDGCEFVLLLNNDCIARDADFLDRAVSLARSEPNVGIVGGKILRWPQTNVIWCTGGNISWIGERFIGMDESDRGQYDQVATRRFISGALMLIRREVVERLGLLPEVYFFGNEDWEYSVRAMRLGYRLLYHPKVVVYHEAGHSHGAVDPVYVYNATLSRILFKKRNLSRSSFLFWRLGFALYLRAVFPIRYRLEPGRFLAGIRPETLLATMRDALRDSSGIERVTARTLDEYRARLSGPHRD